MKKNIKKYKNILKNDFLYFLYNLYTILYTLYTRKCGKFNENFTKI